MFWTRHAMASGSGMVRVIVKKLLLIVVRNRW